MSEAEGGEGLGEGERGLIVYLLSDIEFLRASYPSWSRSECPIQDIGEADHNQTDAVILLGGGSLQ